MHEALATVLTVPTLTLALLVVDQLAAVVVAQDLATVGALRAARAVAASVDAEGRLSEGADERARTAAALALLPDAPADGPYDPGDPLVEQAAARLASEVGVSFPGDLGRARGRTTVTLYAGSPGRWRRIGDGSRIESDDELRAVVAWSHPLRSDPSAALVGSWAAEGRFTFSVEGEARLGSGR